MDSFPFKAPSGGLPDHSAVGGLDIGSRSTKAVVLRDGRVIGRGIASTGSAPETRAVKVLETAAAMAGTTVESLARVVGTGYGRSSLPALCTSTVTEISCHALGNHHANNGVRTILDMGGQDCKVIRCDSAGKVAAFVLNDKCAAGTGRYLEKVAETLEIPIEELGERSLRPDEPAPISRFCPIFLQQELVRLLRAGSHSANAILAGACDSIVDRIVELVGRVGVEEQFAISGGIAQNVGIVDRLERRLAVKAHVAPDPQLMGAFGAALFAARHVMRKARP
ncbi:MAG: acyl-CoA dehydratase activase [Thermoleophilia bacterium]|nr:acyl-CoA dehydratase activase [Thermoleophilia bacterium]